MPRMTFIKECALLMTEMMDASMPTNTCNILVDAMMNVKTLWEHWKAGNPKDELSELCPEDTAYAF